MNTLTLAQLWLLELAVEGGVRLYYTSLPRDEFRMQWNQEPLGLSENELCEAFGSLFALGYICGYIDEIQSGRWTEVLHDYCPSINDIRDAIVRGASAQSRLGYCLTTAGGAYWETIAQPNWRAYFDVKCDWDESPRRSVCSHVATVAAGSLLMLYDVVYNAPLFLNITPMPNGQTYSQLQPWQATYWKTLSDGYQMRFHFADTSDVVPPQMVVLRQAPVQGACQFQSRISDRLHKWYTPVSDLTDGMRS